MKEIVKWHLLAALNAGQCFYAEGVFVFHFGGSLLLLGLGPWETKLPQFGTFLDSFFHRMH